MFHVANHHAFYGKVSVEIATKQLPSNCNQSSQRMTSEDSKIETFRRSTSGCFVAKYQLGLLVQHFFHQQLLNEYMAIYIKYIYISLHLYIDPTIYIYKCWKNIW